MHAARQNVVDYRIEQLDLLREELDALRDAVTPKAGRDDEVAKILEDIHRGDRRSSWCARGRRKQGRKSELKRLDLCAQASSPTPS